VGIIIGAGIYVLIGSATAVAGTGVWLSFVLAAALSALTAMSYMELSSMFPSAAGEYAYARHVFPDRVAFLVGWVMIAGLMVAAAVVSLGFARYASHFLSLDQRLAALTLLVLAGAVAAYGIRESALLTVVLSLIQVGGLLLVIVIGIPHVGDVNLIAGATPAGVFSGAALVFFAFIGFDEVTTLGEETKNPTRVVPLALGLALGVSTLLYVGVAVASVSVLGPDRLADSERPLADVVERVTGNTSGSLMAGLAVISTMNTTLLIVTSVSRVLYGMSKMGALPPLFSWVSPGRRTPVVAIVIAVAVAAAFVPLKDLTLIASVTDVAVYLVFLAVNSAVVVLRLKLPDRERPIRIPGSVGRVPVIPVVAFVAVVGMLTQLQLEAMALAGLLIVAGALVYLLRPEDAPYH
jgi:APA family basic amino acid/polyamine antiporter